VICLRPICPGLICLGAAYLNAIYVGGIERKPKDQAGPSARRHHEQAMAGRERIAAGPVSRGTGEPSCPAPVGSTTVQSTTPNPTQANVHKPDEGAGGQTGPHWVV